MQYQINSKEVGPSEITLFSLFYVESKFFRIKSFHCLSLVGEETSREVVLLCHGCCYYCPWHLAWNLKPFSVRVACEQMVRAGRKGNFLHGIK